MPESQRFRTLTLAVAILLLITDAMATDSCPSVCRFRLCYGLLSGNNIALPENDPLILRTADSPQGPFPCEMIGGGRLRGLRNVTGGQATVARANSGAAFVPISMFRDRLLIPRFAAGHFRWTGFSETRFSTIVRQRSRGSQERALDNLCVRMPIRSHLLFRRDGTFTRRTFRRRAKSCVAFQARVAQLDIEFQWNSSSNYNIRLTEPSGFEISRFGENRVSPTGGTLMQDRGLSSCELVFGRERVTYSLSDTIESGVYSVTIDNSRRCVSNTGYTLRVHLMGFPILIETGMLTDVERLGVLERNFTIY